MDEGDRGHADVWKRNAAGDMERHRDFTAYNLVADIEADNLWLVYQVCQQRSAANDLLRLPPLW